MSFADSTFTGAVSFTKVHHLPSHALLDQLLREVYCVLAPGATFAGSDSRTSPVFRLAHVADTTVIVAPDTFADRLRTGGFAAVNVQSGKGAFRFRASVPTDNPALTS